MVHRRLAHLVLILSLVQTSAHVQSPPPADPIDEYVRAQMAQFHLPGVSFAIVDDGKVNRVGGYGLADVSRRTAATAETVYKIGSVSKQFIATAIMLLVQDGRLDIDQSLSRYLEGTPPAWRPISLRHLLTHTAGLVRESPAFDPMKPTVDADVIKGLYAVPLRFPPGSKWEYSNAGYYVLAEVVTRVSGQSWTEFLNSRVFQPAGMRLTVPTNVRQNPPNRAVGYTGNDNTQPAPEWLALRPSGAFLSTVGDLAKWDALLNTDRILTEPSRRQMWTPVRLNDGTTSPYGFGWHVEPRKDGHTMVWHGGGLPGFSSYFGRNLDDRVSVLVLVNGDDVDIAAVARGLLDVYLKARSASVAR
jgi:CubicO group peptidase (beta-lactamase class C family)